MALSKERKPSTMFRILRIRMFLGLPDPHPDFIVTSKDPDPYPFFSYKSVERTEINNGCIIKF
jgi:hypothetical protein